MPRGQYAVTERPARCPTHPGELLREILAERLKLSVAAARQLGVSRMTLHRLLRGEQAVTPEMALRLASSAATAPSSGCGCRWPATSGAPSARCAPTSPRIPTYRAA